MGVATSAPFTVPEGYMAILRGFSFTVDPVLDLPCNEVLISLLVDDIPQNNYDQLGLGSEQPVLLPTWILADNGQRIALRYDNSAAVTAVSVEVCLILYGNLLLRTGVPIEYEQGNPTTSEPIVRGTPLAAGGGVEVGQPVRRRVGRGTVGGARGTVARYRRPTTTTRRYVSRPERRRAAIAARRRGRY